MVKRVVKVYLSERQMLLLEKIKNRKVWTLRNRLIKKLLGRGYDVTQYLDPLSLKAYKLDEEFNIHIFEDGCVRFFSVKWVYGKTDEPIFITDIPSSGRFGVYNRESKFKDEVASLIRASGGEL